MKKISIILITKNASETIDMCLEKITQQTYPNKEILVLDSGSTDDTLERVNIKLKHIPEVKILCFEDSLAHLRKKAISLATGDYLLFVLPTDELNLYACETLIQAIEENASDLVVGSFTHLFFNGYLPPLTHTIENLEEALSFHYRFMVLPLISGKLYKKEIIEKIDLPDIPLHEEILNLKYLELSQRISTINQILVHTKEHITFFNSANFWENHNSFWFKSIASIQMQIHHHQSCVYLFLSSLEHLLFELLAYKLLKATLEELTMEIYAVLSTEEFLKIIKELPHTGMIWKASKSELLLSNCLALADFIFHHSNQLSSIFLFKTTILVFIKLFYLQTGSLNHDEFLGRLQENMNINASMEAKYIKTLNL